MQRQSALQLKAVGQALVLGESDQGKELYQEAGSAALLLSERDEPCCGASAGRVVTSETLDGGLLSGCCLTWTQPVRWANDDSNLGK